MFVHGRLSLCGVTASYSQRFFFLFFLMGPYLKEIFLKQLLRQLTSDIYADLSICLSIYISIFLFNLVTHLKSDEASDLWVTDQ